MTYPCPHCAAPASAETGCPTCGRGPDPHAIAVVRIDAEIAELNAHLAAAHQQVRDLEGRLGQAWHRRHAAAADVRAAVSTQPHHAAVPGSVPETSSRVMQNVLFLLGGLLLGAAAIVFAAVAWAQFGVGGRALLLASFTVAALAVPPLVLRRGLTATAETMAAVGLLLTLLDGYAAWHVNLFGVADGSPQPYAGVVFAVTAALAAGYALATGLTAARWAALVAAQPVLPLLVAPLHPGAAGWSLTFGALAATNVAAFRLIRPAQLAAEVSAFRVARPNALAAGALAFGGVAALVAAGPAAALAGAALFAQPFFHAPWAETVPPAGWRLPAALALVAAALTVALPARWRSAAVLSGAAAVALTLPAGLALPWWAAPALDLVVVAAALAMAARPAPTGLRTPFGTTGIVPLLVAGPLALHALVVGFGRPAVAALVLTALALFGVGLARFAQHPALRRGGLVTAVVALPAVAWTGAAASGIGSRPAAYLVLGVAATAFLLATRLDGQAGRADQAAETEQAGETQGRVGEVGRARVVEGAAQPGALLALLLTVGSAGHAAAVCTLWGLVLGVRALRPTHRTRYLIAAAAAELGGWILLMVVADVAVLEAYTIPASAVALLAGLRIRPDRLNSRVAYGPALAAALLPSLASVLVADGQLARRLLLGLAALAIVLAGARTRLRAPVEIGGAVLAVLALRELAAVWDLVPRWIPLAGGGLLLVVLAATLERRRRDLTRFRQALARLN